MSKVLLVYDEANNKYVPSKEKNKMGIYEYREPQGTNGTSVSSNGLLTYPVNTELYTNIEGTSFNPSTNEITLPKGDYIIEGYSTFYHNYNTRYAFMKMYLQIVSPATDVSGCCGSNVYYNSGHNQTDYRMNDHGIFNSFLSLNQSSTVKLMLRYNNSSVATELGRATNLSTQTSGGEAMPEVFGSFKFIKM